MQLAAPETMQFDRWPCRGQRACDQRGEMLGDHGFDLRQGNVAGDDQNGIVWRVPLSIPLGEWRVGHALDVMHPAQNRVFIGAGHMGRGFKPLVDQAPQVVVDGGQAFLLDDL